MQKLHTEEAIFFGTAIDKGKSAKFTLQLDTVKIKAARHSDWPKNVTGSGYLGMGLWESGDKENYQPAREYINEDQVFTVHLKYKEADLTNDQIQQLKDALLALGLFGGLGSRARRAFGSMAIESIDQKNYQFKDILAYQSEVSQLLNSYRKTKAKPPFSAINHDTQFSLNTSPEKNARSTHKALGDKFKNYRGQPSKLRGSKKRVFGLPCAGGTKLEEETRRASPLLFHIHPVGKAFVSCILFLPANFHHHEKLEQVDYTLANKFLTQ